jgi:hypothetical protein
MPQIKKRLETLTANILKEQGSYDAILKYKFEGL